MVAPTIPPPVLNLPWSTTRSGEPTTLTSSALEFLQQLWTLTSSGGSVDWSVITGIPPNVTALAGLAGAVDKVPYFTGAGAMAVSGFTAAGRLVVASATFAGMLALISPLTAKGDIMSFGAGVSARLGVGANGTVLTADNTQVLGLKWSASSGGPFPPLTAYGAVENGVTDDSAAVTAWLGDPTQATVWVESATAVNFPNFRNFTKRPVGPGQFHNTGTGDWVPAAFVWITTLPQVGLPPVGGNNYYFSGDISRSDVRYTILGRLIAGGNIRESLTAQYYEPVVTPKWDTLQNLAGYSGVTCRVAVGIFAGATAVTVNSTDGITTGATLGFLAPNGTVAESRVVTVVDATHLTWSGGLANNYPATSALTLGLRTMDPIQYMEVDHFGGGDAYAIVSVCGNAYARTAGQQHWVETATVGLYGGSLSFSTAGVYGTGIEMQYNDNGHDVNCIADVESFNRTNQVGALGTFWGRDWTQTTGIDAVSGLQCPIDAIYTAGGWARTGLDFARMQFLGQTADPAVQPAIQLALGHRIYFNSSVTPGGRGTDPRGIYAAMYGNTPGDMYLGSTNDGVSDIIDLEFARVGGSRIRMRPDSINMNNPVNFGGQIHVAGNMILASGGYLHTIGVQLYFFNGTTDTYIAG